MKSSLLIRTAIAILAANCAFTHPAIAADEITPPESAITGSTDQTPPLADQPAPVGEISEPPVPEGQFVFLEPKEPQLLDEPVVVVETPEPQLSDEQVGVVYYSLGSEAFDPTVIRNFGLEEDPAAAAVERVMTKVIDQAADTAVQPLTPAPL